MIIIGQSLPHEYADSLRSFGHTIVVMPPDPRLPAPVSSHPDMLLFFYGNTLITDQTYFREIACGEIDQICQFGGFNLLLTNEPPGVSYPEDIRFNVLPLGDYFFCHPTHTSHVIRDLAKRQQKILLPTRQGYARCAACPVGSHAIITADPAIAHVAKKQDLDVCFIRQGHVILPGYPHGLIGGCCGIFENEIFFCGDPSLHPDGNQMLEFIHSHGVIPRMISSLPLFDAGSLFFISERTHSETLL
jgi:hypothetical protein